MPANQRGAALVTVMLVVAISVILLAQNVERSLGLLQQERAMNEQALAFELNFLAEAIALEKLREINALAAMEKKDQLNQLALSQTPLVSSLEWSLVSGELEDYPGWQYQVLLKDLQARLNINQLLANPGYQKAYERLAQGYQGAELDSVLDWLDADTEVRSLGAEDNRYLSKHQAYLSANAAVTRAAELRLVDGFTDLAWRALKPNIVALPMAAKVNINTASEQVILALAPDLDASKILASRETDGPDHSYGYTDRESMILSDEFAGASLSGDLYALESSYYELEIIVSNGLSEFRSSSRIDIGKDPIAVFQRAPILDIDSVLYAGAIGTSL